MSKVKLGPTKGSLDNDEFDIADNVLKVVKEYESQLKEINQLRVAKIAEVEAETEKKIAALKLELVSKLGIQVESNP